MGVVAAEHPAGAVDIEDDGQRPGRAFRAQQIEIDITPAAGIKRHGVYGGGIHVNRRVLRVFQNLPAFRGGKLKNKRRFGVGFADSFRGFFEGDQSFHRV